MFPLFYDAENRKSRVRPSFLKIPYVKIVVWLSISMLTLKR
jgi:hypothetical protein